MDTRCFFERKPSPFPIQGLWIGLCNPSKEGEVWADMYVGAVAQYAPDDEELSWLWKAERHYPEGAYAHSPSCISARNVSLIPARKGRGHSRFTGRA